MPGRIKLSDSEIQRRVITAAKTTAERAWLAEVSSVALVQSVNDSRRAWRNFFDSVTGRRRGRRMGRPKMKSRKDHRQSFRLTRNGFSIRSNGRLFLAKVGKVRVRWSRQLLSEPSSVTIIRELRRALLRQFRHRRRNLAAAVRRPAGRRRCASTAWPPSLPATGGRRHRQPEALNPQAAQAAKVRAGEVPPTERISQQGQDAEREPSYTTM